MQNGQDTSCTTVQANASHLHHVFATDDDRQSSLAEVGSLFGISEIGLESLDEFFTSAVNLLGEHLGNAVHELVSTIVHLPESVDGTGEAFKESGTKAGCGDGVAKQVASPEKSSDVLVAVGGVLGGLDKTVEFGIQVLVDLADRLVGHDLQGLPTELPAEPGVGVLHDRSVGKMFAAVKHLLDRDVWVVRHAVDELEDLGGGSIKGERAGGFEDCLDVGGVGEDVVLLPSDLWRTEK